MTELEKRQPMIGVIRGCGSRKVLEDVFTMFSISDKADRVAALKEAMYNPEVFFTAGDMDTERQYETLAGAFLTGIWKRDETKV